jgi:hypothetical protein
MCQPRLITYSARSAGSGFRGMGVRTASEAWGAISRFLTHCAGDPQPKLLRCDLVKFTELYRDEELDELLETLGSPATGHGPGQTEYNWFLSPSEFEKALVYVDKLRATPELAGIAARLEFHCSCDFYLWDPDRGAYLPFQGPEHYLRFEGSYDRLLGQSYLRLSLNGGYSMEVFLSLPFADAGQSFRKYMDFLKQYFPIPISIIHWKRWHINKALNGYVGRKFQPFTSNAT